MRSRIHHPVSTPGALPGANCSAGAACRCCTAIRRARERSLFDVLPEWCSPLTPGVQLVNLSHTDDARSLRVELGRDWPRMFAHLASVGSGLVMTRNEAAILGRRMIYPELSLTSLRDKGASGTHGLWLDFRRLGAARAIHLRREVGHVFGIEFGDAGGHTVHRFTLTPESDFDAFFDWVRLHQACAAESHDWLDEPDPFPVREGESTVLRSDAGAVSSVFAACGEKGLPVCATVSTPSVRHRAVFTPDSLAQDDPWWFASDDEAGLHFNPALFTAVEVIHLHDGSVHRPALRCSTEEHACALLIEAAPATPSGEWAEILESFA